MAVKKTTNSNVKIVGTYIQVLKDTKIMSAHNKKNYVKNQKHYDYLTKALKQLGECLKLKGLGLPEKMKRDEQMYDFDNIKNQNSIISNSEKRLKIQNHRF